MLKNILKFGNPANKFRYELKEEVIPVVEEASTKIKEEAVSTVKEAKAKIKEDVIPVVEETTTKIKEEAVSTVKEITSTSSNNKKKKTSIKEREKTEKTNKKESAKLTQSKQTVKTNPATTYDEPFWVKEMYKTKEQKQEETPSEATFATNNLIAKPMPKRRPGASLDKYKKMAQQSKVKF